MPNLFDPLDIGDLRLRNREIMVPTTLNRARPDGVPGPWAAEIISSEVLPVSIITEATEICRWAKVTSTRLEFIFLSTSPAGERPDICPP